MKKLLTAIFAISITVPAFARTVTGTVVDENNAPMIGATVQLSSDKKVGTLTDTNGKFSLNNVSDDEIPLTVTYVGYKTQTVQYPSNKDMYNVSDVIIHMPPSSEMLDDAVLISCTKASIANAKKILRDQHTTKCVPTECESERYKLTGQKKATQTTAYSCTTEPDYQCDNNDAKCDQITIGDACEDQVGHDCTSTVQNAATAKYEWDGNKLNCVITKCDDHFMLDNDKKCVASDGPCDRDQIADIEHATKGELKNGKCHVTECVPGYEVSDNTCVEISGKCKSLPRKAKSGYRKWDAENQKEICIVTECESGYSISDDKLSCQSKLSEADSRARVDELRENAKKMHDKETSTANKLIGAAGIGATGIGTSQALSALSEQRADDRAENDMRAYLATIKCDYGTGKTVNGGETGIELPGGNELTQYATQYKTLAADLKVRKTALGMSPGIESETIIDAAETGLYDNAATGKTNGAFTSLSRALSDETSADAQAWAQQKADTASKLKTGAIVAGVGAVGSAIANLAVNSGADKKNKSDEILAKYASLYKLEREVAALPAAKIPQCPTGATGTHPDCTCPDGQTYNPNNNTCDTVTQSEEPQTSDTEEPQTPIPEIVSPTITEKTSNTNKAEITLPNDQLFAIGKSTLKPDAQSVLEKFGTELNDSAWDKCTITIVGHTDPVGGNRVNQRLSLARANAVKDAINTTNGSITFKTSGTASANCTCGLGDKKWTFPSDKASDRDYNQCNQKQYNTRITRGRYAPCRRVKITMDCSNNTLSSDKLVNVAAATVTGATSQTPEKVDTRTNEPTEQKVEKQEPPTATPATDTDSADTDETTVDATDDVSNDTSTEKDDEKINDPTETGAGDTTTSGQQTLEGQVSQGTSNVTNETAVDANDPKYQDLVNRINNQKPSDKLTKGFAIFHHPGKPYIPKTLTEDEIQLISDALDICNSSHDGYLDLERNIAPRVTLYEAICYSTVCMGTCGELSSFSEPFKTYKKTIQQKFTDKGYNNTKDYFGGYTQFEDDKEWPRWSIIYREKKH